MSMRPVDIPTIRVKWFNGEILTVEVYPHLTKRFTSGLIKAYVSIDSEMYHVEKRNWKKTYYTIVENVTAKER